MNEELYEHIIEAKTAALFAASCSLGAQLAEADSFSVQALNQYGQKFGLAFQICDDWMDLFGNEEKTGKTIGADLAEGKPTLPVILWLKNLSESDRKKALSLLADSKKHRSSIAKKIRQSEVIRQIQQKLLALQKQAQEALAPLAPSTAKTSLCRLVESITASVNLSRLPQ
jgi:geranylgeranyl pyrophosphate synthase